MFCFVTLVFSVKSSICFQSFFKISFYHKQFGKKVVMLDDVVEIYSQLVEEVIKAIPFLSCLILGVSPVALTVPCPDQGVVINSFLMYENKRKDF